MRATFYGFEMARSALAASQRNIDVTGQNIANINTVGYSRQRVNLAAVGAGNLNWKYVLPPADNVGLGVDMTGIQRVRDEFLDVRFWKENGDNSRFTIKGETLNSLEMLLDEFTTDNVYSILNNFSDTLQELAMNSDEVEYASNARMIAMTLTRTLNKVANDIQDIQNQQIEQLALVKDRINQNAKALDDINKEIINQKLLGPVSNELLDKRDLLLDELSGYGNIQIRKDVRIAPNGEEEENGGISVFFGVGNSVFDDSMLLVDGTRTDYNYDTEGYYNTLDFDTESDDPYRLTWDTGLNTGKDFICDAGQVLGYYEMLNGIGDVSETGDMIDLASKGIPYFMNMLDSFASEFSSTFNYINDDINGGALFDSTDGGDIKAANIRISDEWRDDPSYIVRTTHTDAETPNAAENDNVLRMIDALKREDTQIGDRGFVGSFMQYIGSLNSEITTEVNYNDKQLAVSDGLVLSIANLRDSVMAVSEDEEAMNLMKYQKSYTAAARLMTVLDEMVDTIVNRLGTVGR